MKNNGAGTWLPKAAGRFGGVPDIIRAQGAPAGFRHARDLLFQNFELLKRQGWPPYVILRCAIELDKHALFNEVAQDKTRSAHDAATYEAYQRYLAGDTDIPVAAGVSAEHVKTITSQAPVDEVDDDGEIEEEERNE